MTTCEQTAVQKEMDCSSRIPSFLTAATVTFSASEEIGIYTSIFAIYGGVSTDTPFSLWILDSSISSTLVRWQQLCLNRLALAGPNFVPDLVTVDFHQTDINTCVRVATLLITRNSIRADHLGLC